MPAIPTMGIIASSNDQGGWSGSVDIPVFGGDSPKVYAYNVTPSPGPYPTSAPGAYSGTVTGPAGTYSSSYQITSSSPQQVALQVTIQPPQGGFGSGTLKLVVTLSYGAGGGGIPT